jgi:hypothetical protein
MYKEIEQWTACKKLDALLGLCNCCVYKAFDYILPVECRMCVIRKGILKISDEKRREALADNDLLTAC